MPAAIRYPRTFWEYRALQVHRQNEQQESVQCSSCGVILMADPFRPRQPRYFARVTQTRPYAKDAEVVDTFCEACAERLGAEVGAA